MQWIYIFLGGGLGAISRFGLASGIQSITENTRLQRFPIGILTCNLLGCFMIGVLFGWMATRSHDNAAWLHPLAITGFLGAFTTFSTFALDTHKLFQTSPTLAVANILASSLGSLIAIWAGFKWVNG